MPNANATPYIPRDGSQVLEHLPTRNDPVQRELANLQEKLQRAPSNADLAVALAKRYVELARSDADPRYLGYAQAALARWWTLAKPPADVLVLRATILQSTHHFNESLADLDLLLAADRTNAQAWITRATVNQVQGNFAEAKKSCARLYGLAPDLITRSCIANVANLTGDAKPSYMALQAAFDASHNVDPTIQTWVLTLLAEMAVRLGDVSAAEGDFSRALKLSPNDSYLLGSYCDFLLDQERDGQVVTLLTDKIRADGLLLRYALALNRLRSPNAEKSVAALRDRFEAAMQRGDTVHQREQSRFELQLMRNPARALELARSNWQVQKEPADARVLLEAALGAKDRSAARPVVTWLRETGLQDVALAAIERKLENLP